MEERFFDPHQVKIAQLEREYRDISKLLEEIDAGMHGNVPAHERESYILQLKDLETEIDRKRKWYYGEIGGRWN